VLLIGGWTVAAGLQPTFDPVVRTISDLAGYGASDRWVMTLALVGVGGCHVTTALGLRPAAPAGRVLLAAGGVATVLVAASPLPADGSGSRAHTAAALAAFTALSVWPAVSGRRGERVGWALRPAGSLGAAAVLLGLLGWFGAELLGGGARVGLAERFAAGAQAVWPLVAVISARRGARAQPALPRRSRRR
jgi:hypothetical membrane protein